MARGVCGAHLGMETNNFFLDNGMNGDQYGVLGSNDGEWMGD